MVIKVPDTTDGGRVLDTSAHLLSCDLDRQTALVISCTLALIAVFVLHVSNMYMVRCVNIVFTCNRLLVLSLRYATGV